MVPTGFAQLGQMLRGRIPVGTLTLIDGSSAAGKSVLYQQITRQAYAGGPGRGLLPDHGAEELVAPMASLDMDPFRCLRNNRFRIAGLEAPAPGTDPMVDRVSGVTAENPVVIIDPLTNIGRHLSPTLTLGTFSGFDQLTTERGRYWSCPGRTYSTRTPCHASTPFATLT